MTPTAPSDPERQPPASWRPLTLEAFVAFATMALYLVSCNWIRVYPVDRLGQISGLASLALRFVVVGLVLVAALLVTARARAGKHFELTTRLACASAAGLATAMIGGGILVALHGTPWGLNGKGGDVGALAKWATAHHQGEAIPPLYPPLSIHTLHVYSDLMNLTPDLAIKHLQILGTAAFGPIAYVAWRLVLRAPWALAIGVVATLPMIEPYKPYPNLVLVVFVPLAIKFLSVLREIADREPIELVRASVAFGASFGVLFLTYSGWFQWSAPGLLVATLIVFPWRTTRRAGLVLLALTGIVFVLVTGHYLAGLVFDPAGKVVDTFVYFDVKVEPTYIAMWRNDLQGVIGVWPPVGELGGVGVYMLLVFVGFGAALALGRKTTAMITLTAIMVGAWLMRFLYARLLWETKLVQLYPRTTPLILYCLLVAAGFAVMWMVERAPKAHPLRGSSGMIGALCALLLVFGSAGSATSDRYMPADSDPPGTGWLAYNAHRTNWSTKKKPITSRALPWTRRPTSEPNSPLTR